MTRAHIHYRWHPLVGHDVEVRRRWTRGGQTFVYFEIANERILAVPDWMADAARCASMTLGEPLVEIASLVALSELLSAVRARNRVGVPEAQEVRDEEKPTHDGNLADGAAADGAMRADGTDDTGDRARTDYAADAAAAQRGAGAAARRRAAR